MFGKGEVRSSELVIGLSSSKDHGALEVTSLSTPHKAWGICYALKEKDKKRVRDKFQFLSFVRIRIPDSDNRACQSYANKVCFMRLTSSVDSASQVILLLESFSSFFNLL